jgi:hypothetical protein
MKKIPTTLKVLAFAATCLALAGCNAVSRNSESASMIIINSISGTTEAGAKADYLQSDVADGNFVQADIATANISIRLIRPDAAAGDASRFNDVVLTDYRVTYEVPPGSTSTEVPEGFQGTFSTITCPVNTKVDVEFVVVLEKAKLAAPLINLVGTNTVLERKAKIEIFGRDLADHAVAATGYLMIYFADYVETVAPVKK